MIEKLLHPQVQLFIRNHEQDDENKLILKHREILGVPIGLIADQLVGRKKAKIKIPVYYNTPNIIYPPGLNLEQSSSEKTAVFKADLLNVLKNKKVIADLTGGFGVDSFFLSKVFQTLIYSEPSDLLLQFAKHNHEALGASGIRYQNITAEIFLESYNEKLDCIFIDPSRRDKSSKKVFKLSDCVPNVPELLPKIFEKTECVLIKTSPLLDIAEGIRELKAVEKVWVVSVENECKELLFFCRREFADEPMITAVNLDNDHDSFEFTLSAEKSRTSKFSAPLAFLYEPNASILKAGAFKSVGEKYILFKINVNTHLYTSTSYIQNFPGRVFKIIQPVKPEAKSVREFFPDGKANVITRNYPLTPAELKKKTKLKDGGDLYLIGFSGQKEKHLVAAERMK
jgi:hypothetical protein